MLVKDYMTTYVYTAAPTDSVSEVAQTMKEKNIKHVPVVNQGSLVGILSDRDIKQFTPSKGTALDVFELNYLLAKTSVREIMKTKVFSSTPETPIEEAAVILTDNHIGCLPVIDDGKVVGVISDKDIFRVLIEITGVRRGGHRISLSIEDKPGSIRDVADLIREHGFSVRSILSSHEKAGPGQRYVVIRSRGQGDLEAMKAAVVAKYGQVRFKPE